MKTLSISLVLSLCGAAAVVPSAAAQTAPNEAHPDETTPVTLENTETRALRSNVMDQEFRLLIARPFRPPTGPDQKYPVLYLLDADMSFPLARQVALSLQSGFEIPQVLIVGIAYAGGMREAMVRRTRDYTPTPDPLFTKFAQRWGGGDSGEGGSGGAGVFLRFLREELKPFVEQNYPADSEDAALFGVSFGGLFATYVLLNEPDTFQRYIIGSPSLWWNSKVIFTLEEQYAAKNADLPARVFIAAGGHETAARDEEALAKLPEAVRQPMLEFQAAIDGAAQMVEVVQPFVERLRGRNYPGLDLTFHLFPEETHGSAPPMILSRGLRVLFEAR